MGDRADLVAKAALKGMQLNKVIFAVCFFAFIISPAFSAKPKLDVRAVVDYIVDGDTFGATVLLNDGIKVPVRVRFMNIDAPELSGECESEIQAAIAAKDRLAELIPVGTIVALSEIKDDKYLGRIDAFVADGAGRDIGEIMLREKHARKYGGEKRMGWCD